MSKLELILIILSLTIVSPTSIKFLTDTQSNLKISYQGVPGSYSFITSKTLYPNAELISHSTFKEAMTTVEVGSADFAVIPIENSNAGRVQDVHLLLPSMNLYIVDEYFLPIQHQLLGIKGSKLEDITVALSHPQALAQSSKFLSKQGIATEKRLNTAMACVEVANGKDKTKAAVASSLAAEMYNMEILAKNIQNDPDNRTRFIILARNLVIPAYSKEEKYVTSMMIELNEYSSSFLDVIDVFTSNKLHARKIETYNRSDFKFNKLYIEIDAHSKSKSFVSAFEHIRQMVKNVNIIAVYSQRGH